MSKEITIKKDIDPIVAKAESIKIVSPETMNDAVELLSQCNKTLKNVTAEKEKVTKPMNEALKAERARFKPFETMLETATNTLRKAMSAYQTEMTAKQKAQEEKIVARIGEGKGKLKVETAMAKLETVDKPEESVNTSAGSVKFREVKKFEVMDVTMLPIEYILPDEVAIRKQMVAGVELPGVRYYTEQIPINSI